MSDTVDTNQGGGIQGGQVQEGQVARPDGRLVGYADFAPAGAAPADAPLTAVIWCHGGPGTRNEPRANAATAAAAGLRLIGIDRPGYGLSTPQPGRSIGAWPADALAVADHLGIRRFLAVGCSTGGAYALALAATAPERVLAVLDCCGMTDMRWANEHAPMPGGTNDIWLAPDRSAAIRNAERSMGADGSRMLEQGNVAMSPPDLALLSDPALAEGLMAADTFAHGVQGYVDDRLADAPARGWSSFDIKAVDATRCPVHIIHGEQDFVVPIAHAHHTRDLIAGATLQTFPQHGHLTVATEVLAALVDLRNRATRG